MARLKKKVCTQCRIPKEKNEFSYSRAGVLHSECKKCSNTLSKARYRKKNPLKRKEERLKRLYNISLLEYERMLSSQGGTCKVCPSSTKLNLDHDHSTGKNRGFLCWPHNLILGLAKDDSKVLRALAEYLECV